MLMFMDVELELLALPLVAEPPLALPEVAVWVELLPTFTFVLLLPLQTGGFTTATVILLFTKATLLLRSRACAGQAIAKLTITRTSETLAAKAKWRAPPATELLNPGST